MRSYCIERRFRWQGRISKKVAAVIKMFGVDLERWRNDCLCYKCQIQIRQGDVCYITGASGVGKSVLLRELYATVGEDEKIDLNEIALPRGRALVDCIEGDYLESLRILSKAGLSDVFCVLNQPDKLSDGQKWRFRLAMALASGKKIIFADEFCSNLDRVTAAVIAYNIHKFAKRYSVTFILASSHDDILSDLLPDVIVIGRLSGRSEVIYRDNGRS